jgi:hypothetical protein
MNLFQTYFKEFETSHIDLSNVKNNFKLPIEYNDKKHELSKTLMNDIDMNNVFSNLYGNTKYNSIENKLKKYYTTDKNYLKDHQLFLQNMNSLSLDVHEQNTFRDMWTDSLIQPDIREKYNFIQLEYLNSLNYNSKFLLFMSIYNLASPILTLITPIIFFIIIPFILFKCLYKTMNIGNVEEQTFMNMLNNSRHNPFNQYIDIFMTKGNYPQKIKSMTMLMLYVFSFYQNTLLCVRFYKNIHELKKYLYNVKLHLRNSINDVDNLTKSLETCNSPCFTLFKQSLENTKRSLDKLSKDKRLVSIHSEHFSPIQITSVGEMMSLYYYLRETDSIRELLNTSFHISEYLFHMNYLSNHLYTIINPCKFTNKKTLCNLKNQYHPIYISKLLHNNNNNNTPSDITPSNIIKNTITFKKNIIITGPNASGKTTILKSCISNLIISQQIGMGCYDKNSKVYLYDKFYSYLNIPDTSERDSLFEAEAKRCLEFIHKIKENPKYTTFLLFDEMYSGTNPSEATMAALSFINYLNQLNVSFMITTHYYDICNSKKLAKNIKNMHMDAYENENKEIIYNYKLLNKPSFVRGGINILKRLQYPDEILNNL